MEKKLEFQKNNIKNCVKHKKVELNVEHVEPIGWMEMAIQFGCVMTVLKDQKQHVMDAVRRGAEKKYGTVEYVIIIFVKMVFLKIVQVMKVVKVIVDLLVLNKY